MEYAGVRALSKREVSGVMKGDNVEAKCRTLISISLNDSDHDWVQNLCFKALRDTHSEVKRCALVGLGHIIRIHGVIDLVKLNNSLEDLKKDASLSGTIDDLLSDIEIFQRSA